VRNPEAQMYTVTRTAGIFLLGAAAGMSLSGCAQSAPPAAPPSTVTVTAAPTTLVFDPATSGKTLAARIVARAKAKSPSDKIEGATCANFPNLKVGTHTDCHVTVNGVKVALRATFTERDGHYVLARIKS